MERYSAKSIDEMGRLVLHNELRKRLGLDAGQAFVLWHIGSIVILQKVNEDIDETATKMDELGRIVLPAEMRKKLRWNVRSKIAIYYVDDRMVILKRA